MRKIGSLAKKLELGVLPWSQARAFPVGPQASKLITLLIPCFVTVVVDDGLIEVSFHAFPSFFSRFPKYLCEHTKL